LRRILKAYASYYNRARTHLFLDRDAPDFRHAQPVGTIAAAPPVTPSIRLGFEFSMSTAGNFVSISLIPNILEGTPGCL
jgi:hypothetical protein